MLAVSTCCGGPTPQALSVLLVLEPDLPVRAVAERLVLRAAAAAQCVVPRWRPLSPGGFVQLRAAGDDVRSVRRDVYRWLAAALAALDAVHGVAQRSRRALVY